jgi:hypothetical protein
VLETSYDVAVDGNQIMRRVSVPMWRSVFFFQRHAGDRIANDI